MSDTRGNETQVLIVGGGITGLSAALFLARQGVRPILVERHPSTAILPQARAFNPRTMEIYRSLGLAEEIRGRQSILADLPEMIGGDTLLGQERFRIDVVGQLSPTDAVTPAEWAMIDQDELERIVRARAEQAGVDIRFGTELLDLDPHETGVRATVRTEGGEYPIAADYLIAADGHRAGVRARLGIGAEQTGERTHALYAVFDADLTAALRGRRFLLAYLDQPVLGTVLVPLRQAGRWMFGMPFQPEQGQRPEDFTEARCAELIRQAVGDPELDVTLVPPVPGRPHTVSLSANGGWVAERFRAGRVLFVGDAAHVMPPSGSYGASTGIADAHNLAWKLAAVLSGRAGVALLDTYEQERRPVARLTVAQALRLLDARYRGTSEEVRRAEDLSLIFGYRYVSTAIAGEGPAASVVDPREPTGEPGLRAPHVWLTRSGLRRSTLDLCTGSWTLLVAGEGPDWPAAAATASTELGVAIDVHRIGVDWADVDERFAVTYGIGPGGATLVRPDGFVAWRGPSADLRPTLATLLAH